MHRNVHIVQLRPGSTPLVGRFRCFGPFWDYCKNRTSNHLSFNLLNSFFKESYKNAINQVNHVATKLEKEDVVKLQRPFSPLCVFAGFAHRFRDISRTTQPNLIKIGRMFYGIQSYNLIQNGLHIFSHSLFSTFHTFWLKRLTQKQHFP